MPRTTAGGEIGGDAAGAPSSQVRSHSTISNSLETALEETRAPTGQSVAPEPTARLKSALEILGMVIAPTTLIMGLLFYFGWAFTNSRSRYFGIDTSVLGFSPQDYILRSVNALYHPLAMILVGALLFLRMHPSISEWEKEGRHPLGIAIVRGALILLGTGLVTVGILAVARRLPFHVDDLVPPLGLFFGTLALVYARYFGIRHPAIGERSQSRLVQSLSRMSLSALLILTLFWTVGEAAAAAGLGSAKGLAIASRPGVAVYSKQHLAIDALGVTVEEVGNAETAYRFRYLGLKLLVRSDEKYFLLPATWSPADGAVIVLRDDDSLRVEFRRR